MENLFTEKFLIYGVDWTTRDVVMSIFKGPEELEACGCIGFITGDPYQKEYMTFKTYTMNELSTLEYSKICIVSAESFQILKDHFLYGYGISQERIKPADWLIGLKIIMKNLSSCDEEVCNALKQIKTNDELDDFCGFCKKKPKLYWVNWDSEFDMPYAAFEEKRIYYPRNHRFLVNDGKQYVLGIEYEQQEGSPHLYLKGNINIREGDVLVDAGVCEGNFSIRFVDLCKKIYLIEPDRDWYYPLQLTFRNYMNKVVFCDKYLSDIDDENHITLDSLVGTSKVDFLKMDIEGSEVKALYGAQKTFKANDMKCSICSYHKHGDEASIKAILKWYGYNTDNSSGYMVYLHDPEKYKYCEMRRGIVYGWK